MIKVDPYSVTVGTISPEPNIACFARNRYVPINTETKYSRTQIIYPAEKLHLPAGVRIRGLRFFPCSGSQDQELSGTVYITEITREEKKELVSKAFKSETQFYEWDKQSDFFTILDGIIQPTEWLLYPNEVENFHEYRGGDLLIDIDKMVSTIADGLRPTPIDFQVEYVMHKDVQHDLLENDVVVIKGGWDSQSDKNSNPTRIQLDYHVYPVINIEYDHAGMPVLGLGNSEQLNDQSCEPAEFLITGQTAQFHLRNKGDNILQIAELELEGISGELFKDGSNDLQGGHSSTIEFHLQESPMGSYSGTLNIHSNGGNVKLPAYATTYMQAPYGYITQIGKEPIPAGLKAVTFEGQMNGDLGILQEQLSSLVYIDLSRVDITARPESERLYPKYWLPEAQRLSLPVGTKAIYKETFQECQKLTRLQLPVGLKYIGEEALGSLPNLKTLICLGAEPPLAVLLGNDAVWSEEGGFYPFLNLPETVTIYVPENAIEKYKNTPGWDIYRNQILPLTKEVMDDIGDSNIDGDLPDLVIVDSSIKYPENVVGGDKIDISFDVCNISSTNISNVTLIATLFRGRLNKTWQEELPDFSLQANETKTITFKDVEIPSGETSVDFTIEVNRDGFGFAESNKENNRVDLNIVLGTKQISSGDYTILCDFYNATGGDNWSRKWNISENKLLSSNWNGVEFDDDGNVKKISLVNNNLTGTIPSAVFSLPNLEEISLSNNNLSGKLDEIMKDVSPSSALKTVILSKNPLTGILPSLDSWSSLKTIELTSCKLDSVSVPVPTTVSVKVFPLNMELPDNIELKREVGIKLPAIARFDESLKVYLSDYPDLNVRKEGTDAIVTFKYDREREIYILSSADYPLKLTSEDHLVLAVEGGSKGLRSDFKLLFVEGDANMNGAVGVDDAVTTVNYILDLNGEQKFFNYSAADLYKDDVIDIQDVVEVIDVVLETPLPENRSWLKSEAPNSLSIEDGRLILNTTVPVVGLDVSLKGVAEEQLKSLLAGVLFTSRTTADGCRFILLDMNGGALPAGKTEIATIATTEGRIQSGMLVNGKAEVVPVSLKNNGIPTSNEGLSQPDDFDGRSIFVPDGATDLTVTIYNLAGQPLSFYRWPDPQAGMLDLTHHLNALQPGAYILSRRMQVANKIISKNNKLIIK